MQWEVGILNRTILLIGIAGAAIIATIIGMALLAEQSSPGIEEEYIRKFADTDELKQYLEEYREAPSNDYWPEPRDFASGGELSAPAMQGAGAAKASPEFSAETGFSSDYSSTNIQVQGVDEADFVKNDGKYIYILSGDTLAIVNAYPEETAQIISRTDIDGNPAELFLNGDRLVVFSTAQEEDYIKPRHSVAPVPYWRSVTHAYIYDISDRSNPELERDISMSGGYYDSRMVGRYVYAITTESVPWYMEDPLTPMVKDSAGDVVSPDIYYFDIPPQNFVYNTITSFNTQDENPVESQTYLSGYSATLYASKDNLYLAYNKPATYTRPGWIGPGPVVAREESVDMPRDGTVIHRFTISNGKIGYAATGDVPGRLLNQFSMDEDSDHLRVATTVEGWYSRSGPSMDKGLGPYMYNNVYVLDSGMNTVGELEYIAPDEKIYSTRFIGDRLYMVTFKRIDPFFVIDLSDPENPGILGKLKIPGYSDYLHPYDSNYIIGVGKETAGNEWGGVSTEGVKIALFDVRDVNNPLLVDKVEIGDSGTDSEALHDHKAFLFDRQKNLLVIPIQEVKKVYKAEYPGAPYSHQAWQGAYVFGIDPETGFVKKGTVTHHVGGEPYYYYGSSDAVRRSLYIEDILYTISSKSIILSDLGDLTEKVNEVDLPGGSVYRDVYPMMVE